ALAENVAFVPGEGAFVDGRGRNAMRLNFSASGGDHIREGIRRIGEVIKEQVALYGTLTGELPTLAEPGERGRPAGGVQRASAGEGATVVRLPRRTSEDRSAGGT
ncbi:MAG: PLP-dependent aminotransferase family protein, partial [Thermoleophilaceae bacterium]